MDEWQRLRADHARHLALVCVLLEFQQLVHFEDSVSTKDSLLFEVALVEDCEHFAWGRPACESVANAELFNEKCAIARSENDVGHVGICVVIVVSKTLLEQILLRSYPCWRRRWARWAHTMWIDGVTSYLTSYCHTLGASSCAVGSIPI